jgi:hypothetical protein
MAKGMRKTGSGSKTSVEATELLADVSDLSRVTLRLTTAPERDALRDFWNRWMPWRSRNQTPYGTVG